MAPGGPAVLKTGVAPLHSLEDRGPPGGRNVQGFLFYFGSIQTQMRILRPKPPDSSPYPIEYEDLYVVNLGRFASWVLSFFVVGEEISREEAVRYILQHEVKVRYTPMIFEMDNKPMQNQVR